MILGADSFLSEENINEHKHYLEKMKIKYSVYETCNKAIANVDIKGLNRMRLGEDKKDVVNLKSKILCHELFFTSFAAEPYSSSHIIRKKYRTESSFLYDIYTRGCNLDIGYIILYVVKGNIGVFFGNEICELFLKTTPVLCVDMYEHSYFSDYGFEKEKYLEKALARWDLTKVDKILTYND